MTISRGQMNRQLYMGGGIMDVVPREPALFGGIKRAVKKATNTVKKIVKSPIGKAATAYALTAGLGSLGAGASRAGSGSMFGFLNPENVMSNLALTGGRVGSLFAGQKFTDPADVTGGVFSGGFKTSPVGKFLSSKIGGGITKGIGIAGLSTFLTKSFGMPEEQVESVLSDPGEKEKYLRLYYTNLNKNATDAEVEEFVRNNLAGGGRIGYALGSDELPPDPTTPVNPFKPKPIGPVLPNKTMASNIENDKILEALFEKYIDMGLSPKDAAEKAKEEFDRMSNMRIEETRGLAAIGGKMDTASDNAMQAAGIEGLPVRQNPKGVKELDLRDNGGFIPPVGIKEKEDDIPAMLSNNEFVFTADAVRSMGDGNVDVGAQRMYDMMKTLEAGGRV